MTLMYIKKKKVLIHSIYLHLWTNVSKGCVLCVGLLTWFWQKYLKVEWLRSKKTDVRFKKVFCGVSGYWSGFDTQEYTSDPFPGLDLGAQYAVTVMAIPVPEQWDKFYHTKIFSTRSKRTPLCFNTRPTGILYWHMLYVLTYTCMHTCIHIHGKYFHRFWCDMVINNVCVFYQMCFMYFTKHAAPIWFIEMCFIYL